jgi:hypothetical protein
LDRLRRALVNSRPEAVLHWLTTSKTARATLSEIAAAACPLTHDEFDRRQSWPVDEDLLSGLGSVWMTAAVSRGTACRSR